VENTSIATRQYAKRQRTWFRREQGVVWFPGFGKQKEVIREVVHHLEVGINFSLAADRKLRNETRTRT
jgi:tRNA A37 N6-isopentenylltransferase MiaA